MSGWAWMAWLAGALVGGLGGLVVAWGLLGDRLQGGRTRRRCPRCWHSLEGVPGRRCPECGREAAHERRLFKSRRRWRAVAGGLLLVVLGMAALASPMVSAFGWMSLLPDPARAVAWPWATYEAGGQKLLEDATAGRLGMTSRRMLVWRARQVLRSDAIWHKKGFALTLLSTQGELARQARPEIFAMMADPLASNRGWAAMALRAGGLDDKEALDRLLNMVRSEPDENARLLAINAVRDSNAPAAEVVPVLLEVFRVEQGSLHIDAARALVRLGPEGIAALAGEIVREDDRRLDAIGALRDATAPGADAAAEGILAALRSPRAEVREGAVGLAGVMPLSPAAGEVFAALVAALGDENVGVRDAAQRSLIRVGPSADAFLLRALNDPRPEFIERICTILPARRSLPLAALPLLDDIAADSSRPDGVRAAARRAIDRIEQIAARRAAPPAEPGPR